MYHRLKLAVLVSTLNLHALFTFYQSQVLVLVLPPSVLLASFFIIYYMHLHFHFNYVHL